MTRNNLLLLLFCLLFLIVPFIAGCQSSNKKTEPTSQMALVAAEGQQNLSYTAHTVIFTIAANAPIAERIYKSKVDINVKATIRSFRFDNYLDGSSKPTTTVLLAISGNNAGLSILDSQGAVLAEFNQGKVAGSTVIFDTTDKKGNRRYFRWLLGRTSMASFLEAYDPEGKVVYTEVTTFKKSN